MSTSLRIALFEENPRLFTLLNAVLILAGHSVSQCSKDDYPLATFFQELVDELRPPYIPYYDLFIIDVPDTSLTDEVVTLLGRLVKEQSLPMLLLVESDTPAFELLRANIAVVPVHLHAVLHVLELFAAIEVTVGKSFPLSAPELRLVQQQEREHVQATIQAEQAWITTRRTWLAQRQEWITQRQEWLTQCMMWILQQHELPEPQLEWLDAQRDWLAQQQEEVKQQQRWVQDHQYWLEQRQRRLDQLTLHQPVADVE